MKGSKKSIKRPSDLKPGDIFIRLGTMYRVSDHQSFDSSCRIQPLDVQRVDKDCGEFLFEDDLKKYKITNLGQSKEVVATFYAANSIHQRLNRINP